jgi:hypothetical protein
MPRLRTLTLSDPQRRELNQARDHDARPYVRERCAAILKIADEHTPHWVARHGLLKPRDPDSLYAWLNHYQADGLAGLVAGQQGGPQRRRL